ncbi:MAG: nitroreductase [Firmicutes bacterium]|nr:nitroreductase [Bacillota bacterium]
MSVYESILARRTIRKFKQEKIKRQTLEKLVNAARVAPSAQNLQPLKYIIVDQAEKVKDIFENVRWAGFIAPEGTPKKGEEPTAFIAVLVDTSISTSGWEFDLGAAVQNLILTAWEEGIGACWMGAINKPKITEILSIPEHLKLIHVIALGYIGEQPVSEDEGGSVRYYKDEQGTLHVPKRKLRDVILS